MSTIWTKRGPSPVSPPIPSRILPHVLPLLLLLALLLPLSPARAEETATLPPLTVDNSKMAALQEKMLSLGYEIGTADGIIGAKSQAALRLIQTLLNTKGYDIPPIGMPDGKTVSILMEGTEDDLLQTLLNGSWGSRVTEAQRCLGALGFLLDLPDGQFGSNTESAVRAFESWAAEQKPDLVKADGMLSPAEFAFLASDLSAYGLESPLYFDESHPEELTAGCLFARHAIVIDAVTGETLLEKEADTAVSPASTTKVLTLLTALSLGNPDDKITVPASAADVPADSSLVPVYPGEEMTLRDLLYAMIIRSGNDAANAVAEITAGSVEAFVAKMNEYAEKLGLTASHFTNPHGYTEPDHYMSARDLVIIAREGLMQEEFRKIVTCYSYVLPATARREELPISIPWEIFQPESEYYIPHAAGIKSGFTSDAGFCYVGACQEDGKTLIAAVMGCAGKQSAWTDLRRLFAYGMSVLR